MNLHTDTAAYRALETINCAMRDIIFCRNSGKNPGPQAILSGIARDLVKNK